MHSSKCPSDLLVPQYMKIVVVILTGTICQSMYQCTKKCPQFCVLFRQLLAMMFQSLRTFSERLLHTAASAKFSEIHFLQLYELLQAEDKSL